MKNWEEKLREDYELKKTFDLWAMNFGLKDATGHPPIWDSLIDAFQFVGKQFISDLLKEQKDKIYEDQLKSDYLIAVINNAVKERDKKWLSCLPNVRPFDDDLEEFLNNARAKWLLSEEVSCTAG